MTASRLNDLLLVENGFAFDPANGETYTLSASGRRLVTWLKEGCPIDELWMLLTQEYEVDEATAQRDVDDFLEHLRSFQLL